LARIANIEVSGRSAPRRRRSSPTRFNMYVDCSVADLCALADQGLYPF